MLIRESCHIDNELGEKVEQISRQLGGEDWRANQGPRRLRDLWPQRLYQGRCNP